MNHVALKDGYLQTQTTKSDDSEARIQDREKMYLPRARPPNPARGPFKMPASGFMRNFLGKALEERAAPFIGVRTSDLNDRQLFPLMSTGISVAPLLAAAQRFTASLELEQKMACMFGIESDVWRSWCNFHSFLFRRGLCLAEFGDEQRELALELVREALGARGFETARDIMRLNQHLGEVVGRPTEFGEWFYWISIMGTPSPSEPWGFQLDGHHLNINCFVLGDQVVLTPTFMGSEPVSAESGPYAGTRVFREEEARALRLLQALTPEQTSRAVIGQTLPFDVFAHAFNDNLELPCEGIGHRDLREDQQRLLLELIALYVERERPGHAELRLKEISPHLDATYFAWIGHWEGESAFYYRICNPVILIEFVHQPGVMFANDFPTRRHAHTLVRTPNGNDYGKSLLRRYYERERLAASGSYRSKPGSFQQDLGNPMIDLNRGDR
jgi:Protein of unknown function (DUF3500)